MSHVNQNLSSILKFQSQQSRSTDWKNKITLSKYYNIVVHHQVAVLTLTIRPFKIPLTLAKCKLLKSIGDSEIVAIEEENLMQMNTLSNCVPTCVRVLADSVKR